MKLQYDSPYGRAHNQFGLPPYFIQHIKSVYCGYQAGEFAGTKDLVEQITGQKPISVHDYVIANRVQRADAVPGKLRFSVAISVDALDHRSAPKSGGNS
ncbi:hypothetical protein [Paraburkholderia aromaticivorans]|uniref:hypothetical protein n=1 Tax=Paraburkholderia aromaticivorans TaxID=2026199 RepID=UPI0038BD83D5